MLTCHNFLAHADLQLQLWWHLVEAAPASVALDGYHGQAVAVRTTYFGVGFQQALLNFLACLVALLAELFFLLFCFFLDGGQFHVALFGEFLRVSRAVRRLGSAAIDLCYVAAGRFDGFWELELNPWDMSAGALIVAEAGGRVTDLAGGPFRSRGGSVVASNGRIHDQMVDRIGSSRRPQATEG